jgi:hypothetical protein
MCLLPSQEAKALKEAGVDIIIGLGHSGMLVLRAICQAITPPHPSQIFKNVAVLVDTVCKVWRDNHRMILPK